MRCAWSGTPGATRRYGWRNRRHANRDEIGWCQRGSLVKLRTGLINAIVVETASYQDSSSIQQRRRMAYSCAIHTAGVRECSRCRIVEFRACQRNCVARRIRRTVLRNLAPRDEHRTIVQQCSRVLISRGVQAAGRSERTSDRIVQLRAGKINTVRKASGDEHRAIIQKCR